MSSMARLLFLALAYACSCQGLPVANITLKMHWGFRTPDCVERSDVALVNDQLPGPVLRVKAGQHVHVTIQNHLEGVATTMHWHGFDQKGNPWADGAAGTSECPLPPGADGTYSFVAPLQPGTHYYHGHVGMAKEAGAGGIILVDPADDVWPTDMEHDAEVPLFLQDWYHGPALTLIAGLLQPDFRWSGDPQSILVNGHGHFDCYNNDIYTCGDNEVCHFEGLTACTALQKPYWMASSTVRQCRQSDCPGYYEINATAGKRYLLRIANGATMSMLNVAVEKHQLTVVELDGEPVKPINVSSLDLHAGQRAGVIVVMDQPPDVYWVSIAIRGRSRGHTAVGAAILRYEGIATMPDGTATMPLPTRLTELQSRQPEWDDQNFSLDQQRSFEHPNSEDAPAADSVYRRIVLLSTQERYHHRYPDHTPPSDTAGVNFIGEGADRPENYCTDDGENGLRWAVGRVTYHGPATPVLQSLYFDAPSRHNLTEDRGFYLLEYNKTYEIVLQNYPACNGACETHPWHLHGHHFWVVGTFLGEFNGTLPEDGTGGKLHKRDTVNIIGEGIGQKTGRNEGCGYSVIRFVADNPGAWPFHCHIEWHQVMGMGMAFYYRPETIPHPTNFDDHRVCGDVSIKKVVDRYQSLQLYSAGIKSIASPPPEFRHLILVVAGCVAFLGSIIAVGVRWHRSRTDSDYLCIRLRGPSLQHQELPDSELAQ